MNEMFEDVADLLRFLLQHRGEIRHGVEGVFLSKGVIEDILKMLK